MRFDEASKQTCCYFVPLWQMLVGCFAFRWLFANFRMVNLSELTCVKSQIDTPLVFPSLTGGVFAFQAGSAQCIFSN